MGKYFLVARSNLRKAKGQSAVIVALILLAALMLNLWLMLSTDYAENFERYHDKLNAEHVTLSITGVDKAQTDFISRTLDEDARVSEYRHDECVGMIGGFSYNGGMTNMWLVFMEKQYALDRSIGKAEVIEDSGKSGVYLPMLYKTDDMGVGATVQISVGSYIVSYEVCGFFNSVMMGSHNCSLTQILFTPDLYEQFVALEYAPKSVLWSVRLKDVSDNAQFRAQFKNAIAERFPSVNMMSNDYDTVAQARYISQNICSGILCAMAFLVLLIAIVVIVSNIINYIQVNIKNLGVLKSTGYTSKQLVLALLTQFLSLAFLASVAGSALSYGVFPSINVMMISQTGIPYAMRFLPLPVFISIAVLCGAVALAVWLAARRIRKIEPITALRSGIVTHNFKKNRVPLEKTKAPLNFALALKTTLSNMKHNVTVCVTMLVLSVIVVFSGLMTENVIADMTPFVNLIVGETADSCISVHAEAETLFVEHLNSDVRVEKAYLFNSINIAHVGGMELLATVSDDFSAVNNKNVVFEGRFPKYDNEMAVAAKYAGEKDIEIGDTVKFSACGKTADYLVCGFTQMTNNLGKDCLITRAGYERLGELTEASYYIDLKSGVDIDEFNTEMKEKFAGDVNIAINIAQTVDGASRVYVSLMTFIVIAILAVSALIIAFVLYLLVRTMLATKMRDYGILKSVGYTTGQLVLQTALSFMPSLIISTIVGLVVGCLIINPLMSLFLSSIGVVKCTFGIPIGFVSIAGVVLIVLSFGIACLLSLKARKISPRNLLVGE